MQKNLGFQLNLLNLNGCLGITMVNRQEINDIRDILKRAKIKVTLPRIMIFQILKNSPQGMTAYDIENASLMINNRINLSTIYSTLKLFQNTGLIQRYKINLEQAMYSLTHIDGPIRICCKHCGSMDTINDPHLQQTIQIFCQQHQLYMTSYSLILNVDFCSHCQQKCA
ncbi:hypothetical protein BJI46_09795 [Acinetobacter qingfengensis]|uniref:Transcriptional repressor n=2 Tax=Acinetobacter qingfengensis TaxID=1262585 RepID=A0A1E7RE38_9GAMM|nr:hypothetical protein BJI46_09795 [Acinetobacter qingfengensis]